jgi:hypothetical protein
VWGWQEKDKILGKLVIAKETWKTGKCMAVL